MWRARGVKTAVGLRQHASKTLSDWEAAIGNGRKANCSSGRGPWLPSLLAECDTAVRKEVKLLELILHCSFKEMTHMLLFPSQFTSKTISLPRLLCVYIYMLGRTTLILHGEAEFISNRAQRRTKSVQLPKCGGVSYSFLCCVGVRLRPLWSVAAARRWWSDLKPCVKCWDEKVASLKICVWNFVTCCVFLIGLDVAWTQPEILFLNACKLQNCIKILLECMLFKKGLKENS